MLLGSASVAIVVVLCERALTDSNELLNVETEVMNALLG